MILHLFLDEKVTKRTISLFEEAIPKENVFLVKVDLDGPKQDYPNNVILVRDNIAADCTNYSLIKKVLIHGLWNPLIDMTKSLPIEWNKVQVYWSVWGGDMYDDIISYLGYNMYYEPQYEYGVRCLIPKLFKRNKIAKNKLLFLHDYVDVLITNDEEWKLQNAYIGKYLSCKRMINPTSIYYSLEDILSLSLMDSEVTDKNILVCNSGAVSNNHNYAFKYLSKLELANRKIVTPISYAGKPKYLKHIKNKGYQLFKEAFIPLEEFLPLSEYNKLLLTSGVCVFSNWRQQAIGNIVIALYLGAKVFLSNKNPTYREYKSVGLNIYSLENITQVELDTPLTKEQRMVNKDIIYRMFNHNMVINEIKRYFID